MWGGAVGAHRVRLDSPRRQKQNSRQTVSSSTYVSSRGSSSGGWRYQSSASAQIPSSATNVSSPGSSRPARPSASQVVHSSEVEIRLSFLTR